jgi:hypothetical protein
MIAAAILIFLGNAMMSATLLLFRQALKAWTKEMVRAINMGQILQRSNADLALKLLALSSREN